jgi:hypothetical protein
MEPTFEQKLRAAISAGWRVFLIEVAFITLAWGIYAALIRAHSPLLPLSFGPDASWAMIAMISVGTIGLFKVALWLQAGLLIWGSLWASTLRRQRLEDELARRDGGDRPVYQRPLTTRHAP